MENTSPKVFTNKAISVATFFGGPIAAGLLMAKNFKVFGNETAARNSVFLGIITTALLFAGLFSIPESVMDQIPQSLIPGIYTLVIALLVEKLQGQQIEEFIAAEGTKASNWQAAGYGLLGMLIMGAILVTMVFAIPTKGFERTVVIDKNIKLHHSKTIEAEKAQQLAAVIKQSEFLEGSEGADLFLNTEGDFYRLKFVLPDTTILSDTLLHSDFNHFERYLNHNLNLDKSLKIGFTDRELLNSYELNKTSFEELQVYEPLLYLANYPINDFHTIFYNALMPFEDVKKVESSIRRLKAYFPANQRIDIVFLNSGPDYTIKFFIDKNNWQNQEITKRLKSTVEYIKNSGINNNISLVLIDSRTYEEKRL
ncbi:MAG: hypothetical protein AB7S69_15960 [Salinivirgaceae bacterium]